MKVVAHIDRGTYMVQVTHNELKQVFERTYSQKLCEKEDSYGYLPVGTELNLREIPAQRERIEDAARKMDEAAKAFAGAVLPMAEAARVIAAEKQPTEAQRAAAAALRKAMGVSQDFADWPLETLLTKAAARIAGAQGGAA